jgi:hypothetical protein
MEWAAFLLTVFCAVVFRWEAKDIIWGLWISSLCVGYALIVRVILGGVMARPRELPFAAALFGAGFLLMFFTFHFGMFHFVHSVFLNLFFPLTPMKNGFPNIFLFAGMALKAYWPIVLANLLVKWPDFQQVKFDLKGGQDIMMKPYATVVKIHILIFVFAGMSALHIDRFAMYPILFLFFFPMEMFQAKKTSVPVIFFALFLAGMGCSYAAEPVIMLRGGAVIRGFVAKPVPTDPCEGVSVGDPCTNGVLYAGSGFAGLGSYKYMTTPGNCSNFANNYTEFTPTCNGATDSLMQRWANNSGTTAHNVNTGATSMTDGANNTAILATNYTDTDAARYCANMVYPAGGYTDWHLPSRNELNLVLYAMNVAGKGNFSANWYRSSTEDTIIYTWIETFSNGAASTDIKTDYDYVRCVRRY